MCCKPLPGENLARPQLRGLGAQLGYGARRLLLIEGPSKILMALGCVFARQAVCTDKRENESRGLAGGKLTAVLALSAGFDGSPAAILPDCQHRQREEREYHGREAKGLEPLVVNPFGRHQGQ